MRSLHYDKRDEARRLRLGGRVQGVGFRPFVYRLARKHGLRGWVCNRAGQVEIHAEGPAVALDRFARGLIDAAPPLARPQLLESAPCTPEAAPGFRILPSHADAEPDVHVPPDYFACDDCLAELRDPADRRYRYPFINCTQCGPRYTLIEALPYDRPNTAMAGFPLCPRCRAEYEDPADRRFHAQPLACPECGPQVAYRGADGTSTAGETALAAVQTALAEGAIVAVKGIGGYHLLCDAGDEAAVARLRARKPRPHKPLAVMYPWRGADGLERLRSDLAPEPAAIEALVRPERPIVLCPLRPGHHLAAGIAPGLSEVGAMLPYSPLHHLLLDDFGGPLVATSGNRGGEPVLTDATDAEAALAGVADAFLHHDRPILRPADDGVYRVSAGAARPLRLGRGAAPLELDLPFELERPTLAVGGHMKNTLALAWGRRAVLSPHIGDLESSRARAVFTEVAATLQRLYGVTAQQLVGDAHGGYASRRWAREQALPFTPVWHHHAHASALHGEHHGTGDWLIFTWDGVGLGPDGTLWGGEALLGAPGRWHRVGTLRPFRLPGGERAGREPWRAALGAAWEAGIDWRPQRPADTTLLREAAARGLNAPSTSAAGRLFDAAAALLGLVEEASFEGQGPMWLEGLAIDAEAPPPLLEAADDGMAVLDWRPLLPPLLQASVPTPVRAGRFHAALAAGIRAQAEWIRERCSHRGPVGLCGGVFQNRRLTEAAAAELAAAGFDVRLSKTIPCNDGGLAFGQIVELAH